MSDKHKFCSQCGAPLGENDRFCPVCGAKVLDEDESISENRTEKKPPRHASSENKSRSTYASPSEKSTAPNPTIEKEETSINPWKWLIFIVLFALVLSTSIYIIVLSKSSFLPRVNNLVFSPTDKNTLASIDWDGYIEIWDIKQGKSIHRKKVWSGIYSKITWSQNSNLIAISTYSEVMLFDPKNLRKITNIPMRDYHPIALCINSDQSALYTVNDQLSIGLWDIQKGKQLYASQNRSDIDVSSASFSGDCKTLATIETPKDDMFNKNLFVYQVNAKSLDVLFQKNFANSLYKPEYIGIGHNDKIVGGLDFKAKQLRTWNIKDTHKMKTTPISTQKYSPEAFAMGKENYFAIGYEVGVIKIFDDMGMCRQTLRQGSVVGRALAPIIDLFE